MIPKKIHYCWFGRGEKSKLAKKCIESWKRYCPDYEIIEWSEDNIDVNMNAYTKMCYEQRKYAFLTDYIRLLVIKEHGGIYFDTDVEVVKNFDDLLDNRAFFGFEDNEYVNTGIGFGAEEGHEILQIMLEEYDILLCGTCGTVGCPILNTKALKKVGLKCNGERQYIHNATVYQIECFNPYDDETGRLNKTKNTYSIHWFAKTWLDKKTVLKSRITKPFHRVFGKSCFTWIKRK